MTHKAKNLSAVTGFMRQISLSTLLPFFRKTKTGPLQYPQIDSSIFSRPDQFELHVMENFSQPDQSELLAMEEEVSPLIEAEIYVIYGRKADAEKVLADGVKKGRITADEALRFWSDQSNTRGRTSAN